MRRLDLRPTTVVMEGYRPRELWISHTGGIIRVSGFDEITRLLAHVRERNPAIPV